jgi:hypothetical protein
MRSRIAFVAVVASVSLAGAASLAQGADAITHGADPREIAAPRGLW